MYAKKKGLSTQTPRKTCGGKDPDLARGDYFALWELEGISRSYKLPNPIFVSLVPSASLAFSAASHLSK